MKVSVVHAGLDGVLEVHLDVAPGTTVIQAAARSEFPEAIQALARQGEIGVFGRLEPLDTPLQDGDRVEIYRPLQVDPKERRRRRAGARIRGARCPD